MRRLFVMCAAVWTSKLRLCMTRHATACVTANDRRWLGAVPPGATGAALQASEYANTSASTITSSRKPCRLEARSPSRAARRAAGTLAETQRTQIRAELSHHSNALQALLVGKAQWGGGRSRRGLPWQRRRMQLGWKMRHGIWEPNERAKPAWL